MSLAPNSCKLRALLQHRADLESCLEGTDLLKLSKELTKYRVMSKEFHVKFSSLDNEHLEIDVKVRYLLQQVCEGVRKDGKAYEKLVGVLSRLGGVVRGVCEAMRKELDKAEGEQASDEAVTASDTCLTDKDIPQVVELVVSGSHKWEEIGIALGLPTNVREECRNAGNNVLKLTKVLTEWIVGSYKGARKAILTNLKIGLASEIVQLPVLGEKLDGFHSMVKVLPNSSYIECIPQIESQSLDTEVVEGKSTLVEVQISCDGSESYQWSKDGQSLVDGADYSGVSSNILYINRASHGTEGKYSCCVSTGSEWVDSEEIGVVIIYPPEKKHIMEVYSRFASKIPENSWPPKCNATFINLVLVKQKPMSKCDYSTVQGDVDYILESKEVTNYEAVFREFWKGKLLLVEGRPGSGKTTLVHKVTNDWVTGKSLKGAKLVFLVTLRLVGYFGEDKTLLDLLKMFFSDNAAREVQQELEQCGGSEACFILDGFDEYQIENKKDTVIYELIKKKCLPLCMVIVASRPVATAELRKNCDKRVEVLGFSKDQIYEYLESYTFNTDSVNMVSKLEEFLGQHPNVLHMCYLPVHASIICFLFSEMEGNLPHTETKIYEQFVIATLLRHKTRSKEQLQIKSLKDVCGEEKAVFNSVCKLAFDMIVKSKQVVSKSDAEVSLSDRSGLGLLTVNHTYTIYGNEDLFAFHHLTIQEYLAAYYVHEAGLDSLGVDMNNHYQLKNVFKFYCGLADSQESIQLIDNIKKYLFDSLFMVRCAFESEKVEVCNYVVGLSDFGIERNTLASYDLMALGYVLSKSQQNPKLVLVGCRFDLDGALALSSLASSNGLNCIKCLNLSNFDATDEDFKAWKCVLGQLSFLEELDLRGTDLSKSRIECLTNNVTLPHLQILKITLPLTPCNHPEQVLKLLSFGSQNIKQVIYDSVSGTYSAKWRDLVCCAFGLQPLRDSDISWVHLYNSDVPTSISFSCCSEVVLVNCGIDDKGAEMLANNLNTSVLGTLIVDFNQISNSGAEALASCLSRCGEVQEVSVQCNSIEDSGAIALVEAVVDCTSLRMLDMQGNAISDEGAMVIAKATGSLSGLDLYLHNVNITEGGIERVLEHRASTEIRSMVFDESWKSISEGGIDALRRALQCKTLPSLEITESNIHDIEAVTGELEHSLNIRGLECAYLSEDTVPTQCKIMQHLSNTLQHLDHSGNMSESSSELFRDSIKACMSLRSVKLHDMHTTCVLDALNCCTDLHTLRFVMSFIGPDIAPLFSNFKSWLNLHTLDLSANKLGSECAQYLGKVLVHCKNLRFLDLTWNDFGDSGAVAIAEGLKDHTRLVDLDLGFNNITSEGIAALATVFRSNHLHQLDLHNCSLGSEGTTVLVDSLCGGSLQTLDLSDSELGVEGTVALCGGLKNYTQLVKLNIAKNKIGSVGLASLAKALKQCPNLQDLNIQNNGIISDGVSAILDVMKSCEHLRVLNLSANRIGVDGAAVVVGEWQRKALKQCPNLQYLNIENNGIISDGVSAILDVMKSCEHLQALDLSGNRIGVDGAAVVVGEWQRKYVLELHLDDCFGDPHESALNNQGKCCSSCDHLLKQYRSNDYVYSPSISKVIYRQ